MTTDANPSGINPLFEDSQTESVTPAAPACGAQGARTRRPCRTQGVMAMDCLDMRLAVDHKARSIWQMVEHKLNLAPFYAQI